MVNLKIPVIPVPPIIDSIEVLLKYMGVLISSEIWSIESFVNVQ